MTKKLFIVLAIFLYGCKSKVEKIKPTIESISESIYASGTVKSKNQYQAFAPVNGIVENVFVSEGDTIKKGENILSVSNEAQRLSKENAELAELAISEKLIFFLYQLALLLYPGSRSVASRLFHV